MPDPIPPEDRTLIDPSPETGEKKGEALLPGQAHKDNRIIEEMELKFIEISAGQLREIAAKLEVDLPERVKKDGLIVIGPASSQHFMIVAKALGVGGKVQHDEKIKKIITGSIYQNTGMIYRATGSQSFIMGTSDTLLGEHGKFSELEGTPKKKELNLATQARLNQIYQETWEFIILNNPSVSNRPT